MASKCCGLIFLLCAFLNVNSQTRELIPLEAPGNLTLLEIKERQVLIEWDPVDPTSLRGYFRGYLVRTWNHAGSQVYAFPPDITKANVEFFPFSKNFITVSARNEKYVGPPSDAISFDAPQIVSKVPSTLNVFTLSDKAIFVQWAAPNQPNGILIGYKIYCTQLNGTDFDDEKHEVAYQIDDPEKFQAKLTGLEKNAKYRIGVSALNCAGESQIRTAEITLDEHIPADPFPPKFIYKINYTTSSKDDLCYNSTPEPLSDIEEPMKEVQDYEYYDYIIHNETKKNKEKATTPKAAPSESNDDSKRCLVDCMILWLPDVRNNPGEYFYLKYKLKGEKEYQVTEPELGEDYMILHNFDACKNYEIVLVAVDGEHQTESGILVTPTRLI